MTNVSSQPATTSQDHEHNLAELDLQLPSGISRQHTFTATSRLGAFSETKLKGIGEALDRQAFLNLAEQTALALGSLTSAATDRFLPRHGCLQHTPEQVANFLEKLHELNLKHGAAELKRSGISSISPGEIEHARTVTDYVAMLPRLGRREDNVFISLITRAACLDPRTNEEWPTVELAHASRTIDQNPIARRNLPIWQRLDTTEAPPCPDSVRRITLRPKHDPEMIETM